MNRPKYDQVDEEDRMAQLGSRTNVLGKSFVTDLWTKVLHRAIDDIVLYRVMRENDVPLKEEDIELEMSAQEFLFDDEYRVPMDDYQIRTECHKCKKDYLDWMSCLSCASSYCPVCNNKQDIKFSSYTILEEQQLKDISLRELLSIWDIEDVDGFRKGVKVRIESLVEKKREAASNRTLAKQKKDYQMSNNKPLRVIEKITEADVSPPTEEQLTEFDVGITRVLNEMKELLMQKNRKYGNSATKPVRAFSKADPIEQLKVRIDDKISRIVRGGCEEDEDVVQDVIGYLVILQAMTKKYIS